MAEEKAVLLEHLEIVKNYIDSKDVKNIKSAEFVDDTLRFYTSEDKSGEAVAEITLPEETFLDGSKTEIVSDFSWSSTKYPKSTDPDLDGKAVLVLAVKSGRTVRYSFVSLDSVITRLIGGDTDSASVSVTDDIITLNVNLSELSDNRIVIKDDGLYVETVDSMPTWTVSTDEEVGELFSVGDEPTDKEGTLGSKSVGDIVKIKENGEDLDYIVVHKGNPDPEMYDSSCDGVWLLRQNTHSNMAWEADNANDYENSDIKTWLNSTFLNTIDEKIRVAIKSVKIPFKKGVGNASTGVQSGLHGLPCKVFLLSTLEVGQTPDTPDLRDGAKLSYFSDDTSRIAKNSRGTTTHWWLRSASKSLSGVCFVTRDGGRGSGQSVVTESVRPAFILPYGVAINSDGLIIA